MEKYYSIEDTMKMLPLIKAYCRDIKKCYQKINSFINRTRRLSNLTSLDQNRQNKIKKMKEEIKQRLERQARTFKRWQQELKNIHITVCNAQRGRVDIPVYSTTIDAVVLFCVTPETTAGNIQWHEDGKNCEAAKPYFEKVY